MEKKDKAGSGKQPRREAVFQPEFIEDLRHWVATERRVALKYKEDTLDDDIRKIMG